MKHINDLDQSAVLLRWALTVHFPRAYIILFLSLPLSPSLTLKFKDLVPVLYQEGRYQGEPVTLGVGGFGRVELVCMLVF